jgi:hypothetical protein
METKIDGSLNRPRARKPRNSGKRKQSTKFKKISQSVGQKREWYCRLIRRYRNCGFFFEIGLC